MIFPEDDWTGRVVIFGDGEEAVVFDPRCPMCAKFYRVPRNVQIVLHPTTGELEEVSGIRCKGCRSEIVPYFLGFGSQLFNREQDN